MSGATISWRGREIPALLPGIEFNEATHEYFIRGEKWPSVTGFLTPLKSAFVSAQTIGANWGTSAHNHAFHYVRGTIDMSRVDPVMRPTLEGFHEALLALGFNRECDFLAEYMIYSERLRFAGRFDFMFAVGKRDMLIDLKTGAQGERESRMTGAQLGGYLIGCIEHGLTRLPAADLVEINVQPDGKWMVRKFEPHTMMNIFKSQMTVVNYFGNL